VRRLEVLNEHHAPRFEPAEILRRMARQGERFYPKEGKVV